MSVKNSNSKSQPEKSTTDNSEPTKLILWHVNYTCNLACSYCFGMYERAEKKCIPSKIDIEKLQIFLENSDDIYFIVFTGGGEPFLSQNFIEACELVTKKHYIGLNTNLTSPRVKEFCEKVDPKKVKHIIASLHIEELKKRNLLEKFIDNYNLCKSKGFNITASEVAHPAFIENIPAQRKYFEERGIKLRFDPYIGEYSGKYYPNSYTKSDLKIIGLTKKDIDKFSSKGKYCNAGFNACVADKNGKATVCINFTDEKLGDVYSEIKFREKGIFCPMNFCGCPLYSIDRNLFIESLNHKPEKLKSKELRKYVLRERKNKILGSIGIGLKKISPKLYDVAKKTRRFLKRKKQ